MPRRIRSSIEESIPPARCRKPSKPSTTTVPNAESYQMAIVVVTDTSNKVININSSLNAIILPTEGRVVRVLDLQSSVPLLPYQASTQDGREGIALKPADNSRLGSPIMISITYLVAGSNEPITITFKAQPTPPSIY